MMPIRLNLVQRLSAVGNHDFCPWANRYVYWLKRPIGWFVFAAIATGLVGAFVAPQGWLLCAVVTTVAVVGTVWPWLAIRGVTARIAFDRTRCHEGEVVDVTLMVANRWPWPVWGLTVERGFFDAQDGEEQTVTALARVPGWSRSRFDFQFRPSRRGCYPRRTPVLATGFPFGLWSSQRDIELDNHLLAWPMCVPLASLPVLEGREFAAVGRLVDRAGDDGDLLAARHYRPGDSLRRIHWAHTARRDALIVCERQTASRQKVVVALDEAAFGPGDGEGTPMLDWALRVTASVCRQLHRHDFDLSCELGQDCLEVPPDQRGLRRLLDCLAAYELPLLGPASLAEPAGNQDDAMLIVVTSGVRRTPSRPNPFRRKVVIELGAGAPTGTVQRSNQPWLQLNIHSDVCRQLQLQWDRQCHDDWCAS